MARLLYVEDDPLLRTVTTMALEDAGYDVTLAEDGREALRLLGDANGFDYVVSDISMPGGISGLDVAGAALRSRAGCHLVLMSGYATSQLPGIPTGATFMTKPFRVHELLSTLAGDRPLPRTDRPAA